MLKKVNVEIPSTVAIPCPIVGFKNKLVRACVECQYFNGIGQMEHDGEWHSRFAVVCAHPIERRTIDIEVVE